MQCVNVVIRKDSNYQLLTTCYLLLTTYYLLLTTCYLLLATYYLLLTTCYLLLATYYLLLATCYLLLTTYYLLLATCYLLLATYYLLLTTCYLLLTTCYLLLITNSHLFPRLLKVRPRLALGHNIYSQEYESDSYSFLPAEGSDTHDYGSDGCDDRLYIIVHAHYCRTK